LEIVKPMQRNPPTPPGKGRKIEDTGGDLAKKAREVKERLKRMGEDLRGGKVPRVQKEKGKEQKEEN